jgi:hypothetical protein
MNLRVLCVLGGSALLAAMDTARESAMSHYGEDDLILYYYGEGPRQSHIERHLDTCPACAAAYRDISSTLAMVVVPAVPERGDQYGLEVWQRIRHRLAEAEPGLGAKHPAGPGSAAWSELAAWWRRLMERTFRVNRLTMVAAAATLAIVAFMAGRFWPAPSKPAPAITATQVPDGGSAPQFRQRILIGSVADHLDRSERVLTDIMNASEPGDISAEQRWAEDLLTTSRLYRQDAMDVGEGSVAGVLDDLERSLIEIVHSPSRVSAADLEQMRRRIDAAALLFKVRVLSDELRERESGSGDGATPRTSTRKTS